MNNMKKNVMNDVKINNYFDSVSSSKLVLKKINKKVLKNKKEDNNDEVVIKVKKIPKKIKWINYIIIPISIIFLFGLIYIVSNLFFNAKIFIVPKTAVFNLNGELINVSKSFGSDTNFEIMITSYEESKNLTLGNKEEVSLYSKGEITFHNNFSTSPIKLSKGAHISDENGKEYILDEAITIPGYKTTNSKIISGEIDANITAFLPGDSYNTESPTFKINSFKGTTKYEKIYALIKTPIKGGIEGTVYTLTEENKNELDQYKKNEFNNNFLNKIKAEIPEGYILYPLLTQTTKTFDDSIKSKEVSSSVNLVGTANVIILKRDEFEKSIIKQLIPKVSNTELSQIKITNLDDLNVSFKNKDQKITKDLEDLTLSITGQVSLLWNVDKELLIKNLTGVQRGDSNTVFSNSIGIEKATLKIFPPWQKTIPISYGRIKIIIK